MRCNNIIEKQILQDKCWCKGQRNQMSQNQHVRHLYFRYGCSSSFARNSLKKYFQHKLFFIGIKQLKVHLQYSTLMGIKLVVMLQKNLYFVFFQEYRAMIITEFYALHKLHFVCMQTTFIYDTWHWATLNMKWEKAY